MSISRRAVALVALAIPLVFFWPSSLTVVRWALACALLISLDAALAVNPRHLRISRLPLEPIRMGQSSQSVIEVALPAETGAETAPEDGTLTSPTRPRGRVFAWRCSLSMVQVRDAWPWSAHADDNRHSFRLRAAGEDRQQTRTELRPSRRGILSSDLITVRSWGPLRLGARQVTFRCQQVLRVLPQFPSRKYLPRALTKLQQIEGHALSLRPGQGTEFDSLREWVDGDDVRAIDWRASARSDDKLIVRTWRPERDRHLVMVLDTSRLSAVRLGDTTRLDAHMDAILLLSAVAAKAQDSVSLVAGDRVIHRELRRPEARAVLQALSTSMAGLDPAMVEADWLNLAKTVLARQHDTSLLVLFTAVDPAPVRESLLPVLATLAPRLRVVIACASAEDEEPTGVSPLTSVYQRAAAAQLAQQRTHVSEALATIGVDVIEAPSNELAMAVVDYYLALKARGDL